MNLQLQPFPNLKTDNPEAYLIIEEESGLIYGMTVKLQCLRVDKDGKTIPGWTVLQIKNRDTDEQTFVELRDKSNGYLVAETPEEAITEFVTWYIGKL